MRKRFKFLTCVLALSLAVVPLFGCDIKDKEPDDGDRIKIEISVSSLTIEIGETKDAGIIVAGGIAEITVKDPSIASYNDGKITGLKAGSTEIVVTVGDKRETMTVTVKEAERATFNVTIDGVTKEYKEGDKINKPSTPSKPSTDEFEYEFTGWFVGDKMWDFENDTVTGDVTLEAKFDAKKRVYSVNIDGQFSHIEYGEKIPVPATPEKKPTQSVEYVFDKWVIYGTQTEWDFENDTVKGDVALEPIFTEKVREYTYVYNFDTEEIGV